MADWLTHSVAMCSRAWRAISNSPSEFNTKFCDAIFGSSHRRYKYCKL